MGHHGDDMRVTVVEDPKMTRSGHRRETERTVVPAETHVEQGPLDRQEILDLIRDRLADILEIEPASINEGDSFADDLEADSLALIELVEALEEELGERSVGFRIEDEDLEDLKTVRDAVDYVAAKMG
jgi:acyl carrier protein